eukprot:m.608471 g.608471  ORF g.608471 m.608471 type:complete len:317 (+) comp22486_c0_seq5:223-1173(+)
MASTMEDDEFDFGLEDNNAYDHDKLKDMFFQDPSKMFVDNVDNFDIDTFWSENNAAAENDVLVPTLDSSLFVPTTLDPAPHDGFGLKLVNGVDLDFHAEYATPNSAAAPKYAEQLKSEYEMSDVRIPTYHSPPQSPASSALPSLSQRPSTSVERKTLLHSPQRSPTVHRKSKSTSSSAASARKISRRKSNKSARKSKCMVNKAVGIEDLQLEGISEADAATISRLFPGDALQLDRDGFKRFRNATKVPSLRPSEEEALRKIRRRLLGRTYAKRSRERQMTNEQATMAQCKDLAEENRKLKISIDKMTMQIEELSSR